MVISHIWLFNTRFYVQLWHWVWWPWLQPYYIRTQVPIKSRGFSLCTSASFTNKKLDVMIQVNKLLIVMYKLIQAKQVLLSIKYTSFLLFTFLEKMNIKDECMADHICLNITIISQGMTIRNHLKTTYLAHNIQ